MGLIITDGKNGNSAAVNNDNRLLTTSISASIEHHINHHDGLAFNLLFEVTPTAIDDCFLYVKNQSELDMVIEGIRMHNASDDIFNIKIGNSGTPIGGSTITPANLNTGSGNIATGVFKSGADITGLAGGTPIERIHHKGDAGEMFTNFEQDIIIPKNGTLTMCAGIGTNAISGTLIFNYHEKESK